MFDRLSHLRFKIHLPGFIKLQEVNIAWFDNLRMDLKLLGTFVGMLVVMGLTLGIVGYINLNNANLILLELTQQKIPGVRNTLMVERQALKSIIDEKMVLLSSDDARVDPATYDHAIQQDLADMSNALDQLDLIAAKYNQQNMLAVSKQSRADLADFTNLFNQINTHLADNKKFAKIMDDNAQKAANILKINSLYISSLASGAEDPQKLANINTDLWVMILQTNLQQVQYMKSRNEQYLLTMNADLALVYNRLDDFKNNTRDSAILDKMAQVRQLMDGYKQAALDWRNNDNQLTDLSAKMADTGEKVQSNVIKAENTGWTAAYESENKSGAVLSQGIFTNAAAVGIFILFGLLLAFLIARSITRPLSILVAVANKMATGDLARDLSDTQKDIVRKRKDEIGEIGRAFDSMVDYIQSMGDASRRIAQNDLSDEITPRSDRDELGLSFQSMIERLYTVVSHLSIHSGNLKESSDQLAATSEQARQATGQISQTIQQVALGIQHQTEGINTTVASMEALSQGIEGVARGAQEQGIAINRASEITAHISSSIRKVAGNVEAVTIEASKAAQTAQNGTRLVKDTLQSMQLIKARVDQSVIKVEEMGKRSSEIGIIVETIDDIASQTNLLALNAAIEAARAGEHGKGFAVVADEVRKLAERASSSTREINRLVSKIQTTVNEAVQSMAEGSREVESGVQRADQSGVALSAILEAIETVNRQAREAALASKEMAADSDDMVTSVSSVSQVVEQNNAATQKMASDSSGVASAIENIASVSEENSAALEQVSAAAQVLTDQVQGVSQSAQAMAQVAQLLENIAQEFKLE